jgi:lipid-A-disaccharide synthase
MYAANIIKALPPGVQPFGNGGEQMEAVGCDLLVNVVGQSTIGFIEPLIKIPFFLNVLRKTKQFILTNDIQVVVIIDHQGFNIPLAKWCKSKNIRVISFISPQFWVWGKKEKAIAFCADCDHIACIFKKEYEYYRAIAPKKVSFVGHPLLSVLPEKKTVKDVVVGLFPGSRPQELRYCLPLMLEVAKELRKRDPNLTFKLAVASKKMGEMIQKELKVAPLDITLCEDSRQVIAEAHTSLVASGTVSLEHALVGTPCVVVYKFSRISYWLARWLVLKKLQDNCHGFIALPNILAKKEVCPELLQGCATVKNATKAMHALLTDEAYHRRIQQAFKRIHSQLVSAKKPFSLVADEILHVVKSH